MGQQTSFQAIRSQPTAISAKWSAGKQKCKTSFHYIPPMHSDFDLHHGLEEQNDFKAKSSSEQVDNKTHEAEYWQIENNQEYATHHTLKDMQKIEEIKVKWNEFIKMKKINYLQDYTVLKQIGRGGFGCVHKVKARYTGLYRAAKRIKKSQLNNSQLQKLFEEIVIMMSLDHPNIAKLYEVYDYKSYYVLILELCQGGQLFKKIVTKQLNQQNTGNIMKQILTTLIYLHKKRIVHRDLKPQNMLFESDSDTLKIIDFGIAVKKKPDQVLTQRLGTPYYIAPEVLCKSYGQKCDIWSAGVILYMMISGCPPFRGDSENEVMETILREKLNFKAPVWNQISQDCKNLIQWMLKKNPEQRPTAEQAIKHPWIKRFTQQKALIKDPSALKNLRRFSFQNKLQAVVYTYVVSQLLTSDQKKLLLQIFKELDNNNDGVIESFELCQALKLRKDMAEERVKFLMRIIDTNGSGHIDYTEFLVAAIDPKTALNQMHFEQAFQYFDIDHSGVITFEEIAHFLQDTKQSEDSIKKIFKQVDENNDGQISKEEFVKLLMKQTKKRMKSMKSVHTLKDIASQSEQLAKIQSEKSKKKQSQNKPQPSLKTMTVAAEVNQPELKQNIHPFKQKQRLRDSKLKMSPKIEKKQGENFSITQNVSPNKNLKGGLKKDGGSPKQRKKVLIAK